MHRKGEKVVGRVGTLAQDKGEKRSNTGLRGGWAELKEKGNAKVGASYGGGV